MPGPGVACGAEEAKVPDGSDWRRKLVVATELGGHDVPAWMARALGEFQQTVSTSSYPCFFGTRALKADAVHYSFVPRRDLARLAPTLRHFLQHRDHPLANLAVFFEPVPNETHTEARARFWHILRYLQDSDPDPDHGVPDPDDPYWEFTFAGVQMFVVGVSPTYRVRRSRNLGECMVILFQPRDVFDISDSGPDGGRQARALIRTRVRAWDGIAHHPSLGSYGDPDNREWVQYFLPDDNEAEAGTCPLRTALPAAEEMEP